MEDKDLQNLSKERDSIFTEDDFDIGIYDKHIRQARNAIFVTAGVILLSLIVTLIASSKEENEYLWIDLLLYGAFIIGFIALGFWTKNRPYYAIICALILYLIFIVLNAIVDIKTLFSGIIFKIMIIVYLVKGINDAKAAEEMRQLRK
jgi:peptidoglycan/LPS O-acetylase OafA/YrhL